MQKSQMAGVAHGGAGGVRLRHQFVSEMSVQKRHPAKIEASQPTKLKSVDPAARYSNRVRQLRLAQACPHPQVSSLTSEPAANVVGLLDSCGTKAFSGWHEAIVRAGALRIPYQLVTVWERICATATLL